jgi:hypothetical protein
MKSDRFFYSATAALFLLMIAIGFHRFFTGATHSDGSPIDPAIFLVVATHGTAIAAWFVLFFVQALLISVRNRRLHMTLGWSVLAVAPTIAVTGSLVAIRSVQVTDPGFRFFGMDYNRFLLVMLTEIALYTCFVAVGVLVRKRPKIHRPMMLMASFTLLSGATARMPFLWPLFGHTGWAGLFGPAFLLGAALLLLRCAMTRTFDRWFAAGYAVWVVVFIASEYLALTSVGLAFVSTILKL